MSNQRKIILDKLIERIYAIRKEGPTLVVIDGVDGAGKSYFAQALVEQLKMRERPVVGASVDYFHHPAVVRYKRGKDSAEGFYLDSYNYPVLKEYLLDPFKAGNGTYKSQAYDCDNDCPLDSEPKEVEADHILVMEGIFLQRPELVDYWDLKVFLQIEFATSLARNIQRSQDINRIGSAEKIKVRYHQRYMPGQQLYFKEASPQTNADVLIDNNDFEQPFIL